MFFLLPLQWRWLLVYLNQQFFRENSEQKIIALPIQRHKGDLTRELLFVHFFRAHVVIVLMCLLAVWFCLISFQLVYVSLQLFSDISRIYLAMHWTYIRCTPVDAHWGHPGSISVRFCCNVLPFPTVAPSSVASLV